MRPADTATHRARRDGRGGTGFHTEELTRAAEQQLQLKSALRDALAIGELRRATQPQVDLQTGAVARGGRSCGGGTPSSARSPQGRFIPLAEQTGLVRAIGTWVIQEACRQRQAWRSAGLELDHISVNMAGAQLHSGDLVQVVADALAATGLPLRQVLLEATESFVMEEVDDSVAHALAGPGRTRRAPHVRGVPNAS